MIMLHQNYHQHTSLFRHYNTVNSIKSMIKYLNKTLINEQITNLLVFSYHILRIIFNYFVIFMIMDKFMVHEYLQKIYLKLFHLYLSIH